jgi:biotin carboxylase
MNFLFFSPNFPPTFYKFCANLKSLTWNVFGIGDSPAANLRPELQHLTEYVRVQDLNNYDQVLNAAGYLTGKYGQMSGLESNNEYWLEQDACLRRDLDIQGIKPEALEFYKYKSKMKTKFTAAGIATVPCIVTRTFPDAETFAGKYGYPIFAKPDKGVGADSVCKITNESDLHALFSKPLTKDYIFEVFIKGNLYSYDGLTDKCGNLVFEASHYFETPIDKLKSTGEECIYHTLRVIPPKLAVAGRAAVKGFDLKARFFHIEFFELTEQIKDVGTVGDFVGVEVNMRPGGGFTPEMMNAAKDIDVHKLWAECMTAESVPACRTSNQCYCTNVCRHDRKQYKYSLDQIREKFGDKIVLSGHTCDEENPFGNFEIVGKFETLAECSEFSEMVRETK